MNQSWTCSLCKHSSAESFCFCNREATILCNSCLPTHFSKFPTRYHQNLPLFAYEHHRIPGYFERLQLRTEAVEKAKDSLNQGLQAIDQCIEEFKGKIDEVYKSLWEYGNKVMNEVMRAKIELQEEINKSIEEVEAAMYEEQPRLQGKFSARMRNFNEATQFTLFQYSLNVCEDMLSIINFNWRSEELSYQYQPPYKAVIRESKDLNRETDESAMIQSQSQVSVPSLEMNSMVESIWACRNCTFLNYASNPICYNCQTCPADCRTTVHDTPPPEISNFEVFAAVRDPMASLWICSRCLSQNSASSSQCRCGFANSMIASPAVQEEPQKEVVRIEPHVAKNMCWACPCGYEYNQQSSLGCFKCRAEKTVVQSEQVESNAPKPIKQEEAKREPSTTSDSTVWTCSCGYEYNLKTSEKCTICSLPNPFLQPKQQPKPQPPHKCTKCKEHIVDEPTQLCTLCLVSTPLSKPKIGNTSIVSSIVERFWGSSKKAEEILNSEQKSLPPAKLPDRPLWNCNNCNRNNAFENQKCIQCGVSKPIFKCSERCGTVVEAANDVCTGCLKKKEVLSQTILIGRGGGKPLNCPTCGGFNCKQHAAGVIKS